MSYLGYEAREGEVLDRVQALCRNLTTGGKFTDSSSVPLSDVEQWLTDSYYRVSGELLRYGYGTAVTAAQPLSVLSQIQALGCALQVELSARQGITEPNQRYQAMLGQWNGLIADYVRGGGLEQLGVSRARQTYQQPELTGRSVSRKNTAYSDTDATPARFPRGFGQSKQVPARSGTQTSTDSTEA